MKTGARPKSPRKTTAPNRLAMKAACPKETDATRLQSTCPSAHLELEAEHARTNCPTPTFISLPTRTNSQIGEIDRGGRGVASPSSFLPPVRARSFWSVPVERASDGAAVDDPGVRGGGGGGGGCAGHAPGAPRREGPDRRADVLTPAAHGQRDTLRCLPAPRYLLEEGAQADVHLGDLHRRGAHPFREIHVQSTEECHTMCFSMPPLLVHLSCCQVQQGY